MNTTTYTIDAFDHKSRLDVYLTRQMELSRSKVQKAIKLVGIDINGTNITVPHHFLEEGDTLEVPDLEAALINAEKEARQEALEEREELVDTSEPIELEILFENDDVLVINKPAGVLVHPTDSTREATIMDAAIKYHPAMASVGDKPEERAGIVHRLDRLVSGVMILAKTQDAFDDLKLKFQKRFVHKRYTALVNGKVEIPRRTIRLNVARNKKLGRMVARPESQEGKEAVTDYEVLERYANATKLDIDLHTGRTHQIRVHLHAQGHPVVGDNLYKIRNQKTITFPRLWLHAYKLELALPGSSEASTFEAPVPDELTDLLTTLHRID